MADKRTKFDVEFWGNIDTKNADVVVQFFSENPQYDEFKEKTFIELFGSINAPKKEQVFAPVEEKSGNLRARRMAEAERNKAIRDRRAGVSTIKAEPENTAFSTRDERANAMGETTVKKSAPVFGKTRRASPGIENDAGGNKIVGNPKISGWDLLLYNSRQGIAYLPGDKADPNSQVTKEDTPPMPDPKTTVPYGALGVDENGLPVYGTGVKGVVRKWWAEITDPAKYFQDEVELTPEQRTQVRAEYEKDVEKNKGNVWLDVLFGKAAGDFGLDNKAAELIAGVKAEATIAGLTAEKGKEAQNIVGTVAARAVRVGVDTMQNTLWAGLEVLGMGDTAMRKIHSARQGLDAVADQYKKDENTSLFSKVYADNPFGVIKDIATVWQAGKLADINPLNANSTVGQYMQGSAMAYSMVFDDISKKNFEMGLAEGKDPEILASSYANIGIELAGSIVGDPTNYLGVGVAGDFFKGGGDLFPLLGRGAQFVNKTFGTELKVLRLPWKVVARIPEFGEIIGIGIGKARLLGEADRFTGVSKAFDGLAPLLTDASKVDDVALASAKLDEIVAFTAKKFDDMRFKKGANIWNLAANTSAGKINVISREGNLFLGSLVSSEGVEGALNIISDMVKARRGGDEAVAAAARLMTRANTGAFSDVGNMVGEVLSRLDEVDMAAIFKKYQKMNSVEESLSAPRLLHEELTGVLTRITEEYIPSVDDMLAAEKEMKNAVGVVSDRTKQLASMAAELDPMVRKITELTKLPRFTAQAQTKLMSFSFMEWVPRFLMRNIQGSVLPMATHVGMTRALEIAAESTLAVPNQNVLGQVADMVDNPAAKQVLENLKFENVVADKVSKIQKMIGFDLPGTPDLKNIAGGNKSSFLGGQVENMLAKAGRNEQLLSLGLMSEVIKDNIARSIQSVIKTTPEYDSLVNSLPDKAQQGLLTSLLYKNDGNIEDAIKEFKAAISTGEIEAWRVTEIPKVVEKQLDHVGLLDTFRKVQKEAKSPEDFTKFIDNFESEYTKAVTEEAMKLPSQMGNPPKGEEAFFAAMEETGKADDVLRETYLSWRNVRDQLNKTVHTIRQNVTNLLAQASDVDRPAMAIVINKADEAIREIEAATNAPYQRLDKILDRAWDWNKTIKESPEKIAQIWDDVIVIRDERFQLSKLYPGVDASKLSVDDALDLMWKAVKGDRSEKWLSYNTVMYDKTLGVLEEMATGLGQDINKVAMTDKGGDNVFRHLQALHNKAMDIETQAAVSRYLDQYSAAPETPLSRIGGEFGEKIKTQYKEFFEKMFGISKVSTDKTRKANPLDYIKKNGGISPKDFKDIFGESNATTVLPGLLKNNADGLDNVAVRLVEGGFITEAQAQDLEYVRDYLRGFRKGINPSDADINAAELDNIMRAQNIDDKTRLKLEAEARLKESGDFGGSDMERVKDKAKILKENNASGNLKGSIAADNKEVTDYLANTGVESDAIKKDFGRLSREARGTGVIPKLKYEKFSQSVMSLPNEALGFTFESLAKKAEELGTPVPEELKAYIEAMGGKITRREALEFAARVEMGTFKMPEAIKEIAAPAADAVPDFFDTVTIKQAQEAIKKLQTVPSYYEGQALTESRVLYEGLDNFINDTRRWSDKVTGDWGVTVKSTITDVEDKFAEATKAYNAKMNVVRKEAAVTAVATRNFALHSYDKTYLDEILTMGLQNSLHYWSTRSYARTIETMVSKPGVANTYMAYKEYMTKRHADQPEWYRQNTDIGALMGMPAGSLFFNLEASINPIYGLTGVDFDDPYKRVDWMSRMVADGSKMGASFSPLLNWAIALKMHTQGENEAATRWVGRLSPFTSVIKSASSGIDNVLGKFGVETNTQPLELDPFVWMQTSGSITEKIKNGVDPYERNKVVAALAAMVTSGEITEEQMIEAARIGQGVESLDPDAAKIWQSAIEKAADKRAAGDVSSFVLGAGFKPRTAEDMKIEKFWKDYTMLQSTKTMMTSDQYKDAWNKMRENPEYGQFMEGLLLSRKSGDAMDAAYTYNVLGRVAPGVMSDLTDVIDPSGAFADEIALFYEKKGDFSQMGLSSAEEERFRSYIADMAAIHAIPPASTRQEWQNASSLYKEMNDKMAEQFGKDISSKIGEYYALQNTAEKKKFMEDHPEVEQAMAAQTAMITNTPELMKYYGGISTLKYYYANITSAELKAKYSPEIITDAEKLYDKNLSQDEKDEIKRKYSPLLQYQYEYGNVTAEIEKELSTKYAVTDEILLQYNTAKVEGDKAAVAALDKQYKISQYKKEVTKLAKEARLAVNKKYDAQIIEDARIYSISGQTDDKKTEIENKYSELEAYLNDKYKAQDDDLADLIDFGQYLPDAPDPILQDTSPVGQVQSDILNYYQPTTKTIEQWESELGKPLIAEIRRAWEENSTVPYQITNMLDKKYGSTKADSVLEEILFSLK